MRFGIVLFLCPMPTPDTFLRAIRAAQTLFPQSTNYSLNELAQQLMRYPGEQILPWRIARDCRDRMYDILEQGYVRASLEEGVPALVNTMRQQRLGILRILQIAMHSPSSKKALTAIDACRSSAESPEKIQTARRALVVLVMEVLKVTPPLSARARSRP